jgi:cobaltochelatase CobN
MCIISLTAIIPCGATGAGHDALTQAGLDDSGAATEPSTDMESEAAQGDAGEDTGDAEGETPSSGEGDLPAEDAFLEGENTAVEGEDPVAEEESAGTEEEGEDAASPEEDGTLEDQTQEETDTATEKAAVEEVLPAGTPDNYLTNLVVITGTDSFKAPVVEAYHNLIEKRDPPYSFGLKVFSPGDLDFPEGQARVQEAILNSDAVLLEMVGAGRDQALRNILALLDPADQPEIFLQRSGEKNGDGTWAESGLLLDMVKDLEVVVNKDDDQWSRLNTYILNSGAQNWERLLLHLASSYGDGDVTTTEDTSPILFGGAFVYHPAADVNQSDYAAVENYGDGTGIFFSPEDYFSWYENSPAYHPGGPWIGIMGYDSFFKNGDNEMYVAAIRELERRGLNVIMLYSPSTQRNSSARDFFYRNGDGDGQKEPLLDVLILCLGFQFDRSDEKGTLELFKDLNVPVLNPIYSSDLEEWQYNPAGAMEEVYWQVALPEMEGRIEPVLMGGTVTMEIDEATGAAVTKKLPLPDRIERLAGRAESWARLRGSANSDKKIAIIYYNLHGGKDGITASYLNVPRSLTEILKAMANEGYRLNEDGSLNGPDGQLTEDTVFAAMFSKGRNIGGWAPGELDKFAAQEGIIKLDVNDYLDWYNELPAALRQKVESEWGPAPGQVMVHEGSIIIPGVISGNVYFGPQPMRGWGEDIDKIIHSPDLPPPHQYLAYYFWLQNGFRADAVIHLGTHGTAEWLPGKAVGLSAEDWPDIVQGNMPNIYPYIVNNPGEATQAKRRGYAVIIDHLTAAVANTELYGNLLELHELAHHYEFVSNPANNQPEEDIETTKAKIMRILEDEGLAAELGLDPADTPFAELLEAAHAYLHQLEAEVTPLGLHTFGVPPQEERFDKMVEAIVNYDRENRESEENSIREKLSGTTEEIDMLLLALDGGYIPPGLGKDPVRNPDVMPTGKNIKTFDPRTVPDKGAWEIGKKCADELLETYKATYGEYPESVGVVLWAIETMRTEGQSIAMVMRLMGIEPVWNASGNVTSYTITPAQELGRPRVDVVMTISGLFRDTFTVVCELLDKAARELALADEDSGSNYIKKHYDSIKAEMLERGVSEDEAVFLAGSRIFGAAPGTYGVGLSNMMDASNEWDTTDALAEQYIDRMGYIYGAPQEDGTTVYGVDGRDALISMLKNVQAVVQVRDSIYGTLDNDDVAQYLGGLLLASEWASGKDVAAYIANTRLGLADLRIQTLDNFVSQELRSRLLNPEFIEEMLKEGYAGSSTIAKWFSNIFYMDVTTGAISDMAWHELAQSYIFDRETMSRLDPYALQSIIATALEASRKGFWEASGEDLTKMSDTYIQTLVDYGVVCCHHTCNNIVLNEWLAQFSTLDNDTRQKFEQILAEATGKQVSVPGKTTPEKDHNNSHSNWPREEQVEEAEEIPQPEEPEQAAEPLEPQSPAAVPEQSKADQGPSSREVADLAEADRQSLPAAETGAAGTEAAATREDAQSAGSAGNETEAPSTEPEKTGEKAEKGDEGGPRAFEINPEEKAPEKTSGGVTVWAVLGAVGATALVMAGYMLSRRKHQKININK